MAALVILIAAFVMLALESIAEAGVVSLSRSRARLLLSRAPEDPRRQRLVRITQNRERALGSFAVGRTLAVVISLAAAQYLVIREEGFGWQAVVATGAVGFLGGGGDAGGAAAVGAVEPGGLRADVRADDGRAGHAVPGPGAGA